MRIDRVNPYVTICVNITVDFTALQALMVDNITVDRAVSYHMTVDFNLKVLRSVITVTRKGDFNGRIILRKYSVDFQYLLSAQLNDSNYVIILNLFKYFRNGRYIFGKQGIE